MSLAGRFSRDPLADLPDLQLTQTGISQAFRNVGCATFAAVARYIMNLPYGRNTLRSDYQLVLPEQQGTCSTKHALLAALGRELGISIDLMLGLYDMCDQNTPGVGAVLSRYGLDSLPEAHCFLRYNGKYIDVTAPPTEEAIARQICQEHIISPEDIGTKKEKFHRDALAKWAEQHSFSDVELLWRIRSECIAALSVQNRALTY